MPLWTTDSCALQCTVLKTPNTNFLIQSVLCTVYYKWLPRLPVHWQLLTLYLEARIFYFCIFYCMLSTFIWRTHQFHKVKIYTVLLSWNAIFFIKTSSSSISATSISSLVSIDYLLQVYISDIYYNLSHLFFPPH